MSLLSAAGILPIICPTHLSLVVPPTGDGFKPQRWRLGRERARVNGESQPEHGASLRKELGLLGVFSIAAGAMISSGLFVLPGIAFSRVGPSMVLAYLLAGLFNIPAMFAQAELSTAMPKSGGSYFVVERSLGAYAGTLAGLISWLCISLKAAFACIGIGALGVMLVPGESFLAIKITAMAACLLFATVNLLSVKGSGRLQGILVAGLLGALIYYVCGGSVSVSPARFSPFFTADWRTFLAVTGMVFISYGGLTKVVDVSEEVRNPGRNLPLGMFLAFGVVNVLYVAVIFVTIGVLDSSVLSGSLAPIAEGARTALGAIGAIVIGVAAFLAYATTGNAGILAASRSPLAMSRDGLAPVFLSKTSRRFGTPHVAIIFTTIFMLFVIAFLSVEELAKTASTMFLISFVMLNVAVIVMRRSRIEGYRPSFRVPWFPWLPAIGIVVYSLLIVDMGLVPLTVTAIFLGAASLWYTLYVKKRIRRESAVIFMVRKAVSKKISRTGLEDELVAISLEREGIKADRFDELVRQAPVLDLVDRISVEEFFRRIAEELSPKLNLAPSKLVDLFIERERESSTEVARGLAIPHIVVEGQDIFEVVLVRCRDGIVFSELHPPVHTAFVLVGSTDQRNFHLRALVAVAHIVSEGDFETRWSAAKNADQLRDIVLLSRRQRVH